MLEKLIIGIVVKCLELLVKWLLAKANHYAVKIEKKKTTEAKKEKLLKGIDNAVNEAERIKSALNALNS